MNAAVIIASLAIVALAILVPSDAAPGLSTAEKHSQSTSLNTDKESAETKSQSVKDLGPVLMIQKNDIKSKSDDWEASSKMSDSKVFNGPNGQYKVNVDKSSYKSVDTDEVTTNSATAFVDDPTEC